LHIRLDELEQAFRGRVKPQHLVLIRASLDHLRFLEHTIEQLDQEVERRTIPLVAQLAALDAVPGIGEVAAAAIIAEIGIDMSMSREYPPNPHGERAVGPQAA
jgi:transposase